ncbi:hypothetical protein [Pseudomonas sp. nanlin1]|uniref:hypothetical protein n=1 Tax=Pseudomonas sp. nanlin1 TaxID=3040605 RepID=UPI003890AA37
MKFKLCLALALLPWLAEAAGPSPGACAQAHSSVSQRLAQANADHDAIAAGAARRQLSAIVAQCQSAQQQRQQLKNARQTQQRYQQQRLRQQQLDQQRATQRRIVEQQRLRQQMQQQRLNNQRSMPEIRY